MGPVYRCELCATVFSRPAILRRRERMPDGSRERQVFWVCPGCGAEETSFEELRRRGEAWTPPSSGGSRSAAPLP